MVVKMEAGGDEVVVNNGKFVACYSQNKALKELICTLQSVLHIPTLCCNWFSWLLSLFTSTDYWTIYKYDKNIQNMSCINSKI